MPARRCERLPTIAGMNGYALEPEVAGELGPETVLDRSVHPPRVDRLHYVITGWLGDDVVESFPCFLATKRLAMAVTQELTGASFADALVTVDPQLELLEPTLVESLPRWRWLRPIGVPGVDDIWQDEFATLHVNDAGLAVLRRFSVEQCVVRRVSA